MNLRTRIAILFIFLTTSAEMSEAQSRGFGAGVIIGEPTGLSAKAWISQQTAVAGGVAWGFGPGDDRFQVHVDHLWHFHDAINSREQFSPFVGVGGRLMNNGNDGSGVFGVRVPMGLVWLPDNVPLDVFLEVAPILNLAPSSNLDANGGVGIRFFFK